MFRAITSHRLRRAAIDDSRGVVLEKLERFLYRLTRGKSVVFALNDLSQVKPSSGVLEPHERFLGPIFDEPAIRFFLVFNEELSIFHYLLDETADVADHFSVMPRACACSLGVAHRRAVAKRRSPTYYNCFDIGRLDSPTTRNSDRKRK
jgi:hypothetical protein